MKNVLIATIAFVITAFSSITIADDHAVFTGGMDPQQPMNAQTQLCTLNPGKTMAQYDRLQQKYIAWSKKNGVETTVIRAYPFISHDNPDNRSNTEFVEFLVSDHKTSAKGWQLWLNTPEGKKLNTEWQSIAKCDLKMATVYTRWADVDAMNSSKNRFAMWNWCDLKEGVTSESLIAKHASIVENYPGGIGNIGWFGFFPLIGGANAPASFANILIFPDMAGLMEHKQWIAEGGWRVRQDYYNYVDCQGDSVMIEEIRHQPGT